jgi:hypothetical protein
MIKPEEYIENRLIRHRARLGYKDALVIRRAKMGNSPKVVKDHYFEIVNERAMREYWSKVIAIVRE